MIVDTGASITSISKKDGETIGLDYSALPMYGQMSGIGGTVDSYQLTGISLLFRDTKSSYHVERLPFIVAVSGSDLGLPSLLGADVLRKYKTCFDGKGAVLER